MRIDLFQGNPVLKHSFDFAILVMHYCELLEEKRRFVLANQLLKSGTSIGANIMEAYGSAKCREQGRLYS